MYFQTIIQLRQYTDEQTNENHSNGRFKLTALITSQKKKKTKFVITCLSLQELQEPELKQIERRERVPAL